MSSGKRIGFVLVPGAWCGGWCWRPVMRRLAAAGYEAQAVTFTGVGERRHLLSYDINMETHVNDVLNAVRYSGFDEVVLAAHSYGGAPSLIAADRYPELFRALVLLDSMVPENGETCLELLPEEQARERMLRSRAHDGLLSMPVPERKGRFAETEAGKRFWDMMTSQPIRPYRDRIVLHRPVGAGIPTTFVSCQPPRLHAPAAGAIRAASYGWKVIPAESSHNIHLQHPDLVTEILVHAAQSSDQNRS
ncbi:MAG: alpha/beta hydrolase [Desulfovibrionaceae bacterium]|nr:alpha/beta hydrolase [Desulfovibrionaceae bacterium]